MDAQMEHILKLNNGDIDNPDSTDDSEKSSKRTGDSD